MEPKLSFFFTMACNQKAQSFFKWAVYFLQNYFHFCGYKIKVILYFNYFLSIDKTDASCKNFFLTNNLVMYFLINASFLQLAINHFLQTSTGSIFNCLKYRQLTS